jgi:hypothetical protein
MNYYLLMYYGLANVGVMREFSLNSLNICLVKFIFEAKVRINWIEITYIVLPD